VFGGVVGTVAGLAEIASLAASVDHRHLADNH